MKNLKKEFHFNQNKIFKKVLILINYLLVTSWTIIHLIIAIYQLMNINQAIRILKEINLKKNQKNHLKSNNLWIKKKKVKKVKNLYYQRLNHLKKMAIKIPNMKDLNQRKNQPIYNQNGMIFML